MAVREAGRGVEIKSREVRLETPEQPRVEVGREGDADVALAETDLPYRHLVGIESPGFSDVWLVDVRTGERERLLSHGLTGERLHFIQPDRDDPGPYEATGRELAATVRIRSRHEGVGCRLRRLAGDRAEILFDQPQRGVTPGQAAVLYEGSRVVGGCWIAGGLETGS